MRAQLARAVAVTAWQSKCNICRPRSTPDLRGLSPSALHSAGMIPVLRPGSLLVQQVAKPVLAASHALRPTRRLHCSIWLAVCVQPRRGAKAAELGQVCGRGETGRRRARAGSAARVAPAAASNGGCCLRPQQQQQRCHAVPRAGRCTGGGALENRQRLVLRARYGRRVLMTGALCWDRTTPHAQKWPDLAAKGNARVPRICCSRPLALRLLAACDCPGTPRCADMSTRRIPPLCETQGRAPVIRRGITEPAAR